MSENREKTNEWEETHDKDIHRSKLELAKSEREEEGQRAGEGRGPSSLGPVVSPGEGIPDLELPGNW